MHWTLVLIIGSLVDYAVSTQFPSPLPYVRKGKPWKRVQPTATVKPKSPRPTRITQKRKFHSNAKYESLWDSPRDTIESTQLAMDQMVIDSKDPVPFIPIRHPLPSQSIPLQKLPLELMGEVSNKLGLSDAAQFRSTCRAAYKSEVFPFGDFNSLGDVLNRLQDTLAPNPHLNATLQQEILFSFDIQLEEDNCYVSTVNTSEVVFSLSHIKRLQAAIYCGLPFEMNRLLHDSIRDKVQETLIQIHWTREALFWLTSRLEWIQKEYKKADVLFKWIKSDPARQVQVEKESRRLILMTLGWAARYNNTILFDTLLQEPFSARPNYYTLNEAFHGGNRQLVETLMQQYRLRPHKSALKSAAAGGHLDMVQFLMHHDFVVGDIEAQVISAFEAALRSGSVSIAHYFLNQPFDLLPRKDFLFAAVSSGNVELVRYISQVFDVQVNPNAMYAAQEHRRKRMLDFVLCKAFRN